MFALDRVLTLSDKVEQCFRAHPVPSLLRIPCPDGGCDFCVLWKPIERFNSQRDVCCCRCNHKEMMSRLPHPPFFQNAAGRHDETSRPIRVVAKLHIAKSVPSLPVSIVHL